MDNVLPRDIILIVYKYIFDDKLSMLNREYNEVVSISYDIISNKFATSLCGYWVLDRCCKGNTWYEKVSMNEVSTIRHHQLVKLNGTTRNKCSETDFKIPKNY